MLKVRKRKGLDRLYIIRLFIETDSTGETGTFLPLGIDTDNTRGNVYVCDYRNSCVIKFDDKLEYITQWRIFNHSEQYDEGKCRYLYIISIEFGIF